MLPFMAVARVADTVRREGEKFRSLASNALSANIPHSHKICNEDAKYSWM